MNRMSKNNDEDKSNKNNENSNGNDKSKKSNEGSKKMSSKPLKNNASSTSSTPKRNSNNPDYNERGDCNIVSFTYGNTIMSARKTSQQQQHEIPSLIPFTPDSHITIPQQQVPSRLDAIATNTAPVDTITTTTTSADTPTSIILLARQIQMLGTVLGISVILFLFLLLPSLGASIALGLCGISTLLLGQSIFQYGTLYVQTELSHLVQDRGIISYLPSTLQQYLTTTSFHEYMQDGTFLRDNYYFLLYFLPGLSSDQQAQFIQQLPSRHRDLLYHPGFLSLLLPPSTHPWLFGNATIHQQQQQSQQPIISMDSTTISPLNNASGHLLDASSTPLSGPHVSYSEALRAIIRSFFSWMEWIVIPTSSSSFNEEDENLVVLPTNRIGEQNLQLQQVPPPDMVWTLGADSDDEDDEDEIILMRPNTTTPILMTSSNDSDTIQQQHRDEDTDSHQHEENEDDYVLEEQIVNNAISTAVANITSSVSTSITTYISTTIISTLDHWIPIVTRIGMVSSVAWGGFAFILRPMILSNQYILSTATRPNNTINTFRNTFVSNSGIILWTLGLFSTSMIGSATTMMVLRSNARTAYREAQNKRQDSQPQQTFNTPRKEEQ